MHWTIDKYSKLQIQQFSVNEYTSLTFIWLKICIFDYLKISAIQK